MTQAQFKIQTIAIHVVVEGDWCIPIDCSGNRIGTKIPVASIGGHLDANIEHEWAWSVAIKRMQYRTTIGASKKETDPWTNRFDSLASSLRIRQRLPRPLPRSKQRFEKYSTKTWDVALHRLWVQGHNRQTKALRTGWEKWAASVSCNHNKKWRTI